jgi:hypothetical protein
LKERCNPVHTSTNNSTVIASTTSDEAIDD